MKTVNLPNDLQVWALNDLETRMLYHELFVMQSYSKHGIQIADGDCIFDVGANIGLYSLFLAQSCPTLRIFAFEPIPDIFAVLQRNIETHAAHFNIQLINAGLSDKRGGANFEFDPASSMTTTMRPSEVEGSIRKSASVYEWLTAGIQDMHTIGKVSDRNAAFILRALASPIMRPFAAAGLLVPLIWAGIKKKLFLRRIDCELTTISDVIAQHGIASVNLLKIDVEGSERAVIDGIAAQDWSKIQQFVVEVHDVDGRVKAIQAIFDQHGYRTIVDQEAWALHKLLGIYTLYAYR